MPKLTNEGLVLPDEVDVKIRKLADGRFRCDYTERFPTSAALRQILDNTMNLASTVVDCVKRLKELVALLPPNTIPPELLARAAQLEIDGPHATEADGKLVISVTFFGRREDIANAMLGEFNAWTGAVGGVDWREGLTAFGNLLGVQSVPLSSDLDSVVRED